MAGTVIGVIPARLNSSRLPGKLLLSQTGKTVLQHTWERVMSSEQIEAVYVATEDEEIVAVAEGFGAKVVRSGEHENGTSRVAAAARIVGVDDAESIVVNIQGDEPEIDPLAIDRLVLNLRANPWCGGGTLVCPRDLPELHRACTCVDIGNFDRILYFSRQPISNWRHVGVYAYRANVIEQLLDKHWTWQDRNFDLECLRAIDHEIRLHATYMQSSPLPIDTQADYDAFVAHTLAGEEAA